MDDPNKIEGYIYADGIKHDVVLGKTCKHNGLCQRVNAIARSELLNEFLKFERRMNNE